MEENLKHHQHFAATCFNQCWEILEKDTLQETDKMMLIHLAHTSLYHWLQVGTPLNEQRGYWMLAKVYTFLEDKTNALQYAQKCLELTIQHKIADFDLAYTHEAMARAAALSLNNTLFLQHYKAALVASESINKVEDKSLFLSDLKGGNWYGMKYSVV